MTLRRLSILLTALLLALALPGCTDRNKASSTADYTSSDDAVSADTPLPYIGMENFPRMDGSTANLPLMASIYSEVCGTPLEEAQTIVNISGGTGAVWRNMMYEGADLLLVYEAPENIKEEMMEMGLWDELEIVPLGRDGLVFLVNSQNPLDNLARSQLIDIYTGSITDWSEAGGTPGPIAAFQRNLESGSQTLFLALLMQGIEPMTPPSELQPAGMGALIDAVSEYDGSGGAIGYSVYYYADLMYDSPNLKLLSVDGVEPSTQSIRDGTYPLVNDFYVVIRKNAPEGSPARVLRDWLLTDEGRRIMTDANYIPAQ